MQEIGKRIGLLRLLLADVEAKQVQLQEMEGQYRGQLARIVDFVVSRDGDAANALSLMAEVQGKLDEVLQTKGHLAMIEEKVRLELEMLALTKRVSEARSQLAELEQRQKDLMTSLAYLTEAGPEDEDIARPSLEPEQIGDIRLIYNEVSEVSEEIKRLHRLITEASERAVRTLHTNSKQAAEPAGKREAV